MSARHVVLGAALTALMAACGEDPLWPYDSGDRYRLSVVEERVYVCAPRQNAPPPDTAICGGDTATVLLTVDSLKAEVRVLTDGDPLPGPRGVPTPEFQGTAVFRIEATVEMRRCPRGEACEELGGVTTGRMVRHVEHCPLVDSVGFDPVFASRCAGRAGDTLITVTVDLTPGPGQRQPWQVVVSGEETADGAAGSTMLPRFDGRTERRRVWTMERS